ncbi:hypothetical protein [Schlesneria paludicola]|uniref:hypothetical protein n=1 Tax=Schlesneria paludicola TaxID=360056 RepID=UPI0004923306|nr:hypothetical protein [Schlesneria paludicola]
MSINLRAECDQLHRIVGTRDEHIRQLERAIVDQQQRVTPAAREWNRLVCYQKELADWLIESGTDEVGMVIRPRIDAELAGELFVPCSFHRVLNGRRYLLELVSTEYDIKLVRGDG